MQHRKSSNIPRYQYYTHLDAFHEHCEDVCMLHPSHHGWWTYRQNWEGEEWDHQHWTQRSKRQLLQFHFTFSPMPWFMPYALPFWLITLCPIVYNSPLTHISAVLFLLWPLGLVLGFPYFYIQYICLYFFSCLYLIITCLVHFTLSTTISISMASQVLH